MGKSIRESAISVMIMIYPLFAEHVVQRRRARAVRAVVLGMLFIRCFHPPTIDRVVLVR